MPGDVLDSDGQVIVAKGDAVDSALLARLDEHTADGLTLGANWPPIPENSVMSHAEQTVTPENAKSGGEEARAARRYEWQQAITIELEEPGDSQGRLRTLEIDTCDISTTGLGFRADGFMYPGTRVYLTFRTLPERPRIAGEVMYCTYEGRGKHRIGVRFLAPEEGLRHTSRLGRADSESEKSAA